jgi:hypothetical protein
MKITTTKVIQELQKKHIWGYISPLEISLIKDVIKIIDKKLKEQKGISIK